MVQVKQQYIDFLKHHGAAEIDHSGEDFLSHLVGTFDLLKKWKQADDVCLAGLFHSVYGTEVFKTSLIPADLRPKVIHLIGETAENLAFMFGIMVRSELLKQLQLTSVRGVRHRYSGDLLPKRGS